MVVTDPLLRLWFQIVAMVDKNERKKISNK
jgi:hypothetical protein